MMLLPGSWQTTLSRVPCAITRASCRERHSGRSAWYEDPVVGISQSRAVTLRVHTHIQRLESIGFKVTLTPFADLTRCPEVA